MHLHVQSAGYDIHSYYFCCAPLRLLTSGEETNCIPIGISETNTVFYMASCDQAISNEIQKICLEVINVYTCIMHVCYIMI